MPEPFAPRDRRCASRYDHAATTTGAIIVPSCGFDSLPSDLAVFLSNRTLKKALGPQTQLGLSESFFRLYGSFSGGTMATLVTQVEQIPPKVLEDGKKDYALSPGTPSSTWHSQPLPALTWGIVIK